MVASAILPELATQLVVPVAAAVGIAFAVLQWFLVSKVKVTAERGGEGDSSASAAAAKDGGSEYLIEEEEGLNDHNVVLKCAEIQTAISEGEEILEGRLPFVRYWWAAIGMILSYTLDKMVLSSALSPKLTIRVLLQFHKVSCWLSAGTLYTA